MASSVAERSRFGEDRIRAAVGALFLALSVLYVVGTVKDAVTTTTE